METPTSLLPEGEALLTNKGQAKFSTNLNAASVKRSPSDDFPTENVSPVVKKNWTNVKRIAYIVIPIIFVIFLCVLGYFVVSKRISDERNWKLFLIESSSNSSTFDIPDKCSSMINIMVLNKSTHRFMSCAHCEYSVYETTFRMTTANHNSVLVHYNVRKKSLVTEKTEGTRYPRLVFSYQITYTVTWRFVDENSKKETVVKEPPVELETTRRENNLVPNPAENSCYEETYEYTVRTTGGDSNVNCPVARVAILNPTCSARLRIQEANVKIDGTNIIFIYPNMYRRFDTSIQTTGIVAGVFGIIFLFCLLVYYIRFGLCCTWNTSVKWDIKFTLIIRVILAITGSVVIVACFIMFCFWLASHIV